MARGIDFSKIQPDPEPEEEPVVRDIVPFNPDALQDFLEGAGRQYPFFGVLLPDPKDGKVGEYIRTQWDQLNAMTGSMCLLVTTAAPEQLSEKTQATLIRLVGESNAKKLIRRYHYKPDEVTANTYQLAREMRLDYESLPCLALMTDLNSNQRLIQRVPNWGADDLTRFFEALFDRVNHHRQESDLQRRLNALKGELGMGFMLRLQTERAARGIRESLAAIEWSEVIQSTLTNKDLMAGAFKLLLSIFGVAGA